MKASLLMKDVLAMMAVLNNELDLTVNGADEKRALNALVMACRHLDTVVSTVPKALQRTSSSTIVPLDLVTVANVPTTFIPGSDPSITADHYDQIAPMRRIDNLWMLADPYVVGAPDSNRQIYIVDEVQEVGGSVPAWPWPLELLTSSGTGAPRGFYLSGDYFNWIPVPDKAYHIRMYGYFERTPLVFHGPNPGVTSDTGIVLGRSDLCPFPDAFSESLAVFAARRLRLSIDDDSDALEKLASELFLPVIKSFIRQSRIKPQSMAYSRWHNT